MYIPSALATVRPGQVIVYNGWEPYQFRGWTDQAALEPGMIKWLHLAGGQGHLRTGPSSGSRCPSTGQCGEVEKMK
jgi:hypothetical protein